MRLFEISNLLRLRTIAIAVPLAFAISLGIFTDQVLERLFSLRVAQILATAILTLAVITFAFWIFGVLEDMQAVIARQRARERDQAAEVARMEERERIGMDLHDGVIQTVYAVQLRLEESLASLEAQPEMTRCVNESIDDLTAVAGKMRRYIFGLRPYIDGDGDLARALADLMREAQANTSLQAELHADKMAAGEIAEGEASVLLEVARDAVASAIRRHATCLTASLATDDRRARLDIRDNGASLSSDYYTFWGRSERRTGFWNVAVSVSVDGSGNTTVSASTPLSPSSQCL